VKQVGALITRLWSLAWRQLEPALVGYGLSQEEASDVCKKAMDELAHPNIRCLGKYHMVTAIKGVTGSRK
jgi:hypothetical protein